ncbi:hypothetical protein Tco_0391656, partial [Tanacetum coccineum]
SDILLGAGPGTGQAEQRARVSNFKGASKFRSMLYGMEKIQSRHESFEDEDEVFEEEV